MNSEELKKKGAEFINEYKLLCERFGMQIEPRMSLDVTVTPPKKEEAPIGSQQAPK